MFALRNLVRGFVISVGICPLILAAAEPVADAPELTIDQEAQLDRAGEMLEEAVRLEQARQTRESLSLGRQALEIFRTLLGDQHRGTARAMDCVWRCDLQVGLACLASREYEAARTCLAEARAIGRMRFGKNHPRTEDILFGIAKACFDQQDFLAGKLLLEQSLETYQQLEDQQHATGLAFGALGLMYWRLGDAKTSRGHFEQSLAILAEQLGENHVHTGYALDNLGALLYEQNDFAAALACRQRALAIKQELFGQQHSQTAQSLVNLGVTFHRMGNTTNASVNFNQALKMYQELYGEQSVEYADALDVMGCVVHQAGDLCTARFCMEHALAIRGQTLDEKQADSTDSRDHFDKLLDRLDDTLIARAYLEDELALAKEQLGEQHPVCVALLLSLGRKLYATANYVEAKSRFEAALEIQREARGENHLDCAATLKWLGHVLIRRAQPLLSQSCFEQALAIELEVHGEKSPEYADSLIYLGRLCDNSCDTATARAYLEHGLAICTEIFGEDDAKTKSAAEYLSAVGKTPAAANSASTTTAANKSALTINPKAEVAEWKLDVTSANDIFRRPAASSQSGSAAKSSSVDLPLLQTVKSSDSTAANSSSNSNSVATKPVEVDIFALRRSIAEQRSKDAWWRDSGKPDQAASNPETPNESNPTVRAPKPVDQMANQLRPNSISTAGRASIGNANERRVASVGRRQRRLFGGVRIGADHQSPQRSRSSTASRQGSRQ